MHVGRRAGIREGRLVRPFRSRRRESTSTRGEHTRRRYNRRLLRNAHRQEKRDARHPHTSSPKQGDVLLLVGTMKGAFILRANESRKKWEMGGPYFPGSAVYGMAYDGRAGRHRIWAGPHSMHWGALLRSSDDFGKTLDGSRSRRTCKFPEGAGRGAEAHLADRAGPRYGSATRSTAASSRRRCSSRRDAGESWSLVEGLWNHPQRPKWQPGGGGLCLHTILLDPARRVDASASPSRRPGCT